MEKGMGVELCQGSQGNKKTICNFEIPFTETQRQTGIARRRGKCNKDKLEEVAKIKKFQDKVLHLELEQRPGYEVEQLRNSVSPEDSVGSPAKNQVVKMEENVEQQTEQIGKQDSTFLASVAGQEKNAHRYG